MPAFINLTGLLYGRLTVTKRAPNKGPRTYWWCQCVCGTCCAVAAGDLRSRHTQSCGCLGIERQQRFAKAAWIHGMRHRPEYAVWLTMKQRCANPKEPSYSHYGGRGITVCAAWQESFMAFYTDMGARPSADHSIERRDNDGPYSPENTYWATPEIQGRNKRNNHMITIGARTACLAEWLHITGMISSTVKRRVKRGLSWEEALLMPPDTKKQHGRKRY